MSSTILVRQLLALDHASGPCPYLIARPKTSVSGGSILEST
jgi:hypothetical protein